MKKAIYPGSFDPMTKGHIDIIKKGLKVFDLIYVVIAINPDKEHMLSIEERTNIVKLSMENLIIPKGKKIVLIPFKGIISTLSKELDAMAMIRGIRNAYDMQDEYAIEQFTDKSTEGELVTLYFSPSPNHIFTSSTLVRNFIKGGYINKAESYMDNDAFNFLCSIISEKPIMIDTNYSEITIVYFDLNKLEDFFIKNFSLSIEDLFSICPNETKQNIDFAKFKKYFDNLELFKNKDKEYVYSFFLKALESFILDNLDLDELDAYNKCPTHLKDFINFDDFKTLFLKIDKEKLDEAFNKENLFVGGTEFLTAEEIDALLDACDEIKA